MAAARFRPPKAVSPPERPSASWVPPLLRRSRRGSCNLSRTRQRMDATSARIDVEGDGRISTKKLRRLKRMAARGIKPKERAADASTEKQPFFRELLERVTGRGRRAA